MNSAEIYLISKLLKICSSRIRSWRITERRLIEISSKVAWLTNSFNLKPFMDETLWNWETMKANSSMFNIRTKGIFLQKGENGNFTCHFIKIEFVLLYSLKNIFNFVFDLQIYFFFRKIICFKHDHYLVWLNYICIFIEIFVNFRMLILQNSFFWKDILF